MARESHRTVITWRRSIAADNRGGTRRCAAASYPARSRFVAPGGTRGL